MSRLIDADALLESIVKNNIYADARAINNAISNAPTFEQDSEPVKGVVIREGLPTLLSDKYIKQTDIRLYTSKTKPNNEKVFSKAAYDGAREDLLIWKNRALEAEEKVRIYDQRIVDVGVIAMTPLMCKWVELSDEYVGMLSAFDGITHIETPLLAKFIRTIEAKIKELNSHD